MPDKEAAPLSVMAITQRIATERLPLRLISARHAGHQQPVWALGAGRVGNIRMDAAMNGLTRSPSPIKIYGSMSRE